MSFGKDLRFRDHEARFQESIWARQSVPSAQDYQTVGETVISPNKNSLSGTTFGASARSVLLPVNNTVQGKIAGFATHRSTLSPRPGPGSHATSLIDRQNRQIWRESRAPKQLEKDRIKYKINLMNHRLTGDLPHETNSQKRIKERRNELCRTLKCIDDIPDFSFSQSYDPASSIATVTSYSRSVTKRSQGKTLRPQTAM